MKTLSVALAFCLIGLAMAGCVSQDISTDARVHCSGFGHASGSSNEGYCLERGLAKQGGSSVAPRLPDMGMPAQPRG